MNFKKVFVLTIKRSQFTSSETQTPPSSRTLLKAFFRNPFGYWTVPPTPWMDSAKNPPKVGPLGMVYVTTWKSKNFMSSFHVKAVASSLYLFQLPHVFISSLAVISLAVASSITLIDRTVSAVGASEQTLVRIWIHQVVDAKRGRDAVLPGTVGSQAHGVGAHS